MRRSRNRASAKKASRRGSLRVFSEVPLLRVLLPLSLLGRAHLSALPLALTFLIASWTGSYTQVGLATGAIAVGQGIAGPLRGRLADRGSASRLLFTSGIGYGTSLIGVVVLIAVLPGSAWPAVVLLLFGTGLMLPPVGQVARSIWPRITEGDAQETVFSLDATGYAFVSLGGPVLATGIVTAVNSTVAVLACVGLAAGGAVGFGLVVRRFGLDRAERKETADAGQPVAKETSLLRESVFVRAILINFGLIAAFYTVELSLTSYGRDLGNPGTSGLLVALWSLGSLAGGILVASLSRKPGLGVYVSFLALSIGLLAVLLPPVTRSPSIGLLIVVTTLGGAAVSPSVAASSARMGVVAPQHRRAEAFGWLSTASTSGAATALSVTGLLLDRAGPSAGLGFGALMGVFSAVLAFGLPAAKPLGKAAPPAERAPQPVPATEDAPTVTATPVPEPFREAIPDHSSLVVGTPIFDELYAEYRRKLQNVPGDHFDGVAPAQRRGGRHSRAVKASSPQARVVVVGITTELGAALARALLEQEAIPVGLIQDPGRETPLRAAGVEPVVVNTDDGAVLTEQLRHVMRDADAVVLAAGTGSGPGSLGAATRSASPTALLSSAAEEAGVRRYVMVSALPSSDIKARLRSDLHMYLREKVAAERELRHRDLDWCVLRTGRLTTSAATGHVTVRPGEDATAEGEISRADLATVIVRVLWDTKIRGVYAVTAGATPVDDAFGPRRTRARELPAVHELDCS